MTATTRKTAAKSEKPATTKAGTTAVAKKATTAAKKATAQAPVAAKKVKKGAEKRIYVLDTNVLLHDPYSPIKFQEHIVFIPMVTIEELDNKKAGTTDVNRNARTATRLLEDITSQQKGSMEEGYPLAAFNNGLFDGVLRLQTKHIDYLPGEIVKKNDNLYLAVLAHLEKEWPQHDVVMVTKDLNLRLKARALGYRVDDYRHDHAVDDTKIIARGIHERESSWFNELGEDFSTMTAEGITFIKVPVFDNVVLNEFLYITDQKQLYQVIQVQDGFVKLELQSAGINCFGIKPRNEEQQAALALLTDTNVDLVALLGPAGTGKTLLTLAGGLQQSIVDAVPLFDEIIFTRATVALGEEVGFLPGNEEEKMMPWLGAMNDNLEVLAENNPKQGKDSQKSMLDRAKEVVQARAITFMRGRTFQRRLLILDEAQNLTPKQMKALVTRAGNGTKIVCMGNLAQIDSPYLSEQSSGLSYLVQRFKGWPHFGALVLDKGERSRLANEANTRL